MPSTSTLPFPLERHTPVVRRQHCALLVPPLPSGSPHHRPPPVAVVPSLAIKLGIVRNRLVPHGCVGSSPVQLHILDGTTYSGEEEVNATEAAIGYSSKSSCRSKLSHSPLSRKKVAQRARLSAMTPMVPLYPPCRSCVGSESSWVVVDDGGGSDHATLTSS